MSKTSVFSSGGCLVSPTVNYCRFSSQRVSFFPIITWLSVFSCFRLQTEVKSSVSVPGLHKLREEREAVRPFSAWEEETFNTIVDWCTNGCPDDAFSYPPPVRGKHRLPGTDLHLALDSIAKFIDKGGSPEIFPSLNFFLCRFHLRTY